MGMIRGSLRSRTWLLGPVLPRGCGGWSATDSCRHGVSHPLCLWVPGPQPSTSERPRPPSRREARPRPASPSPPRAAPTPPTRASPRQRAPPGAAAPLTGWTARPWARAPWSWRRCHPGPAPSPPHSSSRPFLAGRSCGAWRGSGSGGRPSGFRYGRRRRQRKLCFFWLLIFLTPWILHGLGHVEDGLRGSVGSSGYTDLFLACSKPDHRRGVGQGCCFKQPCPHRCPSSWHHHPWQGESGAQKL